MAIKTIYVVSDNTAALKELCAGVKALAETTTAVMFGDEAAAQAAAACGANALVYCPVGDVCPEDYAAAIADEVKKADSALVVVYNTIRGRCLAGKLGALLDTAVLTGITELKADGDKAVCSRVVYGGTAQRTETFSKPYGVVTVNSGVFEAAADETVAEVRAIAGAAVPSYKVLAREEKKEGGANLAVAKRIVDVGRGLAAEADLEMVNKLAAVLGAEVGCSRPVAENNKWLPKASYLGITGTQVKPEMIFVMGVSGQVQHIGGINKSKVIVAVNKDKGAPIFKNCDFGLVGDMYKIVPALIEKLS
ncbi:MAG: electron transfer flavoprotein subunit alpha/FixB family protein [Faecalibacterium sp.]|nr:electron transfer flavoprotein subunit alpha/FixB family protein [Faecalibacterium sp.]